MAGRRDGDTDDEASEKAAADAAGTLARLYVSADLETGAAVALDQMRAHYLRNVLRRKPGEAVALFNGRDGEWRAQIAAFTRGGGTLEVRDRMREQPDVPDLWLAFAPVKRARIDYMAEKATELGVSALCPVLTRHTAVTRVNLHRLEANAMEAAEQTERLSVPLVYEPMPLSELLAKWDPQRRLLVCAEAGPARPIAAVLAEAAQDRDAAARPWAILTGPEGGFSRAELDALARLPFVTAVGLGPRILRADTAALAALACWQAIIGDGADRPPVRPRFVEAP
jgi:16S rRNA (uracil1498-N3)-methyltransferase